MINDAALYDENYFRGHYTQDLQREAMYRQEQKRIVALCPKGGKVLDIGCGTGRFLEMLDDRFDKYGTEPSYYAGQRARERGIILYPSLDDFSHDAFDMVVMRGVLQHMNSPLCDLARAVRLLKPGGLLAILATPDADSLVYRIWGRLPPLDAPRNWIIFGHRELENILKRLGCRATFLYPYWETPYARPIRDFAKFALSLFFGWRPFAFPGNQMECFARKG